jgi:hypothetical protein
LWFTTERIDESSGSAFSMLTWPLIAPHSQAYLYRLPTLWLEICDRKTRRLNISFYLFYFLYDRNNVDRRTRYHATARK